MSVTMKAIAPEENKFVAVKISKLEEALCSVRAKMQLHASYQNIRHLIDKEKELEDMLRVARQQYYS